LIVWTVMTPMSLSSTHDFTKQSSSYATHYIIERVPIFRDTQIKKTHTYHLDRFNANIYIDSSRQRPN